MVAHCGAGILGGIGFTMSIFTTNLAFPGHHETVNAAKMAILLASLSAGLLGYIWFRLFAKPAVNSEEVTVVA
ncbi:MAG: Na+/H+ antiporter NhaA [Methylotenera sp.]|nr:Na+/H+ antiporter NhaA [Methylotenera sp.]MDI1309212.1 Na+/H+ antiporter NhaA [Methylotenera sp.]